MLYRCYRWLNPNDWCFNPHDADFPYFSPTFLPSIRLLEVGVPLHLFIKNGEVAAFAVEILRGQARWMNSWGLSTKKTHFKWSLMNNPPNQYKQRKGKSRLKRFSSDRSYVTTVLETCGDSERCFFLHFFWFFKWFQCFCSMVLNSIWIVWFNGSMVSLFNIQNWTTKTLNSVFWSSLIVLKICEWFSLADLKHHETASAGPSGLGRAKGCGEPRVRVDWTWCVESGISVKVG